VGLYDHPWWNWGNQTVYPAYQPYWSVLPPATGLAAPVTGIGRCAACDAELAAPALERIPDYVPTEPGWRPEI